MGETGVNRNKPKVMELIQSLVDLFADDRVQLTAINAHGSPKKIADWGFVFERDGTEVTIMWWTHPAVRIVSDIPTTKPLHVEVP
jgi:hypothetical protein